jgi:hypothetical protein
MDNNYVFKGFSVSDFELFEEDASGGYYLKKPCIIFNKEFNISPLEVKIFSEYKITECIPRLNEYIQWLGNCKNELQTAYCNKYKNKLDTEEEIYTEEMDKEKWYEQLLIWEAIIEIHENNKICAYITCRFLEYDILSGNEYVDKYSFIDIVTEDNNIKSIKL